MRAPFAALFAIFVLAPHPAAAATDAQIDAMCRPFFGSACSEALGEWLPRIPHSQIGGERGAPTTVRDEIVDPAGTGDRLFLSQRGVYGGTFFVYGMAGPPKGHAVYDRADRIVYFDEGCCSWHHVVVASGVNPPSRALSERALTDLRTTSGVRLGDDPAVVRAIYGPVALRPVSGAPYQQTAGYDRVLRSPGMSLCLESTTFLFDHGRLSAMDFVDAC